MGRGSLITSILFFFQMTTGYNAASDRHLQVTYCHVLNPSATYFCPVHRYCTWNSYGNNTQVFLSDRLGYVEDTWNYNRAINMPLEITKFSSLREGRATALTVIGFTEDTHDCCHTHYGAFDWSDLLNSDYDEVRNAWGLLGYDEESWTNDLPTDFSDLYWDELPEEQRVALGTELCYTRELWNQVPMQYWSESAMIPGSSEMENPPEFTCPSFYPNVDYYCPVKRYCVWNAQNTETQQYLGEQLGYNEKSWNYNNARNSEIELRSFDALDETQMSALLQFGFTEDTHDCCQNHYEGYAWSDFASSEYDGIRNAWNLLGYNQTSWDNGEISEHSLKLWEELSNQQQFAASKELCFSKELWNAVAMQAWPENVKIPGEPVQPLTFSAPQTTSTPKPTPLSASVLTPAPTQNPTSSRTSRPSSVLQKLCAPIMDPSDL